MGDAGFHEGFANLAVAVLGVEGFYVFLGVEGDLLVAQPAALVFEEPEDPAADAVAAAFLRHGHAADVGAFAVHVGEEAAGSDDHAVLHGDGVDGVAGGVGFVQLDVGGDALLANEDANAQGERALQFGGGFDPFDGDVVSDAIRRRPLTYRKYPARRRRSRAGRRRSPAYRPR